MFKIKRTFAFILAVITCMTFCLVNTSAVVDWYDFTGSGQVEYFSINNYSNAGVYITNWGYDEEDNDLMAVTLGYNDYAGYFSNILLEVYAEVNITFDDLSSRSLSETCIGSCLDEEVDVFALGTSLDFWDKCVQDFVTTHELYQYTVLDGTALYFDYESSVYTCEQLGNTICIGTND